jgi:hypothetical protein
MRIYTAFGWIWFATDLWYWSYEPVDSPTDPVAFEYGGTAWTYLGEGPNHQFETGTWSSEDEEGF